MADDQIAITAIKCATPSRLCNIWRKIGWHRTALWQMQYQGRWTWLIAHDSCRQHVREESDAPMSLDGVGSSLCHGAECAPTVCTYVHVDAFVSTRSHSSVSARRHSSVSARSLRNKVDALQAELWSLRSRRKHRFLVSLVLLYRDPGLRWAEILWRETGGRYIFVADDGHCRTRRADARIG